MKFTDGLPLRWKDSVRTDLPRWKLRVRAFVRWVLWRLLP